MPKPEEFVNVAEHYGVPRTGLRWRTKRSADRRHDPAKRRVWVKLDREFLSRGGCGRRGPYDSRVMEQVGIDDDLLGAWRRGRAERRDLYLAVRAPMHQAARQGIGSITASKPDPQDVEDAVCKAFLELERKDPATVVSVVGLARKIAYRRGQDTGREIIRLREEMHTMVTDRAITAGGWLRSIHTGRGWPEI